MLDLSKKADREEILLVGTEMKEGYEKWLRERYPQAQYPRGFEGMDTDPLAHRTAAPTHLQGTQAITTIAPEKIAEMRAYARNLHKKHPEWKPSRVMRKTAEYFKIKLT